MLFKLLTTTVLLGTLTTGMVNAQATPAAKTAEVKKHTTKAEAIKEIMSLMEVNKLFSASTEQLVENFPKPLSTSFDKDQSKFDKIYKDTLTKMMTEQMKKLYDKITPEVSKLFETEFTLDELQTIIDFYKSPVGKKQIQLMPKISKKQTDLIQSGMLEEVVKTPDLALRESLAQAKKDGLDAKKIDDIMAQLDGKTAPAPAESSEDDDKKTWE